MTISVNALLKGGVYFSDGAWGTELMKKGYSIGECPELLNKENPDIVSQVAKSYVAAGSTIILTNTFGGNRIALSKFGLEEQAAELNMLGVSLSREAAQGKALVFASMGPTGKMIAMGEVNPEDLYDAFFEQADSIKKAGAHGIVVETMGDLEEYSAALFAAVATGLPVVGSMSFDSGKDNRFTMMGVSIEQMVRAAEEAGAAMVGANCGVGIENYVSIAEGLLEETDLPIWIKANAGLPQIKNGQTVYTMTPEDFALHARKLVEKGVRVVGGCCGTTPAHIKSLCSATKQTHS